MKPLPCENMNFPSSDLKLIWFSNNREDISSYRRCIKTVSYSPISPSFKPKESSNTMCLSVPLTWASTEVIIFILERLITFLKVSCILQFKKLCYRRRHFLLAITLQMSWVNSYREKRYSICSPIMLVYSIIYYNSLKLTKSEIF